MGPNNRTKEVTEKQKELAFNNILSMFSNDSFGAEAKARFIKLCKSYYTERKRMEQDNLANKPTENPKRAQFHNEIMETFTALRTNPGTEKKCPAYRRDIIGNAIMEWFNKGLADSC